MLQPSMDQREFLPTIKFGTISDGEIVVIQTHSHRKRNSSRTGKTWFFMPSQSRRIYKVSHYRHFFRHFQTCVSLSKFPKLTFVKCRHSDEIWSDIFNVALPTFVKSCHSDEMSSDVLNVTLPTSLYCRSFDVSKLSHFQRHTKVSEDRCIAKVSQDRRFREASQYLRQEELSQF